MIAMKLGWLATEMALVCAFLYTGSHVVMALVMAMIVVPLCIFPLNLFLKKRLLFQIESAGSLRKGEDGTIAFSLKNPTVFPVFRMRCQMEVVNQLNGEEQMYPIRIWAFPLQTQRETVRLTSRYCGRIRISVKKITLYDCFGIFGVSCSCDTVLHLTVQPDTFDMEVTLQANPYSMRDNDLYSEEKAGADLTEIFQMREYVPGDSPRQIHWKLSNKFDKLIVRDPAMPIVRDVLVFWERTGQSGQPDKIDAQAEVVVSLCRALVENGIQFCMGWNDTDRNLCILHEIQEMDDLVGIIPRLLRATGIKEGVSGAGLLTCTRPDALCSHMVYVAETLQLEVQDMQQYGHVTLLLNGEDVMDEAMVFDAREYTNQLAQMEI